MNQSKSEYFKVLNHGCAIILASFSIAKPSIKEQILRQSIAKSISQLKSILELNEIGQILDCYIIYRAMLKSPPQSIVSHLEYQTQIVEQNSVLISTLTISECLNLSSLKWRGLVFDFIESFGHVMRNESNNFELNFEKIKYYMEQNETVASL